MIPGSRELMLGTANLMLEDDIPPFPRRPQHRQTDLQCCHCPTPVVQRRPAVDDRRIQFIDDLGARDLRLGNGSRCASESP